MRNKSLWYLKREETVKGPFPAKVIRDYLLLGRIHDHDLVSTDKNEWQCVRDHDGLYPPEMLDDPPDDEKLHEAKLKVDERCRQRRSDQRRGMAEERRKARDRRMEENPDFPNYRKQRARVFDSFREQNAVPGNNRILAYLIVVTGVLIIGGFILNPGPQDNGADCYQPPRPGIDWNYCKLQGINLSNTDLTGASLKDAKLEQAVMQGTRLNKSAMDYAVLYKGDLGFADFADASLKGVDFRNADLSYANFTNADLSYADMSGANVGGADFTDAKLDNAIWVDSSTCLRGSVGTCIRR